MQKALIFEYYCCCIEGQWTGRLSEYWQPLQGYMTSRAHALEYAHNTQQIRDKIRNIGFTE